MQAMVEHVDDVTVVVLPGVSLDASNAKEFKRGMTSLLNTQSKVVFDLQQVQFVDSSGLGGLLSCLRQLTAVGGELKLCGMAKSVRDLFALVRMDRIFDIFSTQADAIVAFQEKGQ
jgi:anti-sigma B factor antagonist